MTMAMVWRSFGLRSGRGWYSTSVRIRNSLSGELEPLAVGEGETVKWYICGPTVYDDAHLGHARNYVSLDVIRRLMERKFGRHVHLCINVTDVDDKILDRQMERKDEFPTPLDLSRHFESKFWNDLRSLDVLPPSVVTRVSDYIPEIIGFVAVLIDKGFAYESGDGSVYFDTDKIKHRYGKFVPVTIEDEGDHDSAPVTGKRRASDFALWKGSVAGDHPTVMWDSPWGTGRPGWHIECSAMSGAIFGSSLDLHSGGVDLKFPHHENEIAQSEAHYCTECWTKQWIHTGHLHIAGRKMSKSLKNFITVQEFLRDNSPSEFRLFCLLHQYSSPTEFSDDRIRDARAVKMRFSNLISDIRSLQIRSDLASMKSKWTTEEFALQEKLSHCQREVHNAFANDFDCPTAISRLLHLTTEAHAYLKSASLGRVDGGLLESIGSFIISTLSLLGLNEFDKSSAMATHTTDEAMVDSIVALRHTIKVDTAREGVNSDVRQALMQVSDKIRDHLLVPRGIEVKDHSDRSSWTYSDRSSTKTPKKKGASADAQEGIRQKAMVPPEALFADRSDLYSQYDKQGIPTHDSEGSELSKSKRKKMAKQYEKQRALHEKYKQGLYGPPSS